MPKQLCRLYFQQLSTQYNEYSRSVYNEQENIGQWLEKQFSVVFYFVFSVILHDE